MFVGIGMFGTKGFLTRVDQSCSHGNGFQRKLRGYGQSDFGRAQRWRWWCSPDLTCHLHLPQCGVWSSYLCHYAPHSPYLGHFLLLTSSPCLTCNHLQHSWRPPIGPLADLEARHWSSSLPWSPCGFCHHPQVTDGGNNNPRVRCRQSGAGAGQCGCCASSHLSETIADTCC